MKEIILSEKTLIPLSLVIILLTGMFWISNLAAKVDTHQKQIDNFLKLEQDHMKELRSIDVRLSRIEGALDIKGSR